MKVWMRWTAAAVLLAAAGFGGWRVWGGAPHGNIDAALRTDLSGYDDDRLLAFIEGLKFDGSSLDQRLSLFLRIKGRFDSLEITQKLSLMLKLRKMFEAGFNSALMANGRLLMQEYWSRELGTYMKATPADRLKLLDARIDEALVYENLQKVQDAARSLFGQQNQADEIRKMQEQIADAIADSMKTRPAAERAAASQYFMEMRDRRLQRGLPVLF